MVRPSLIDLNPIELNYYQLTRRNEVKMLVKHISYDCKCKFNSSTCNSNQKWNNGKCPCECKKYCSCKKDYSWNPSICTCENSEYLKSIAHTLVMVCNEIINATDIVSTYVTNTIRGFSKHFLLLGKGFKKLNLNSVSNTQFISGDVFFIAIYLNQKKYKQRIYI